MSFWPSSAPPLTTQWCSLKSFARRSLSEPIFLSCRGKFQSFRLIIMIAIRCTPLQQVHKVCRNAPQRCSNAQFVVHCKYMPYNDLFA